MFNAEQMPMLVLRKYETINELLKNNLITFPETGKTKGILEEFAEARKNRPFKFRDLDAFAEGCNWKNQRMRKENYRKNNELRKVNDVLEDVLNAQNHEKKMEILLNKKRLTGVGIPVASSILFFLYPEKYCVLDYHVWDMLTVDYDPLSVSKIPNEWIARAKRRQNQYPLPTYSYSIGEWESYIAFIQDLAKQFTTTPRAVERTLYLFSKCKNILET